MGPIKAVKYCKLNLKILPQKNFNTYSPEASSIMRALSDARCTDVRLYTL